MKIKPPAKLTYSKSIRKSKTNQKYKGFNFLFLATILLIISAVGLFNVFINPYGVFNTPTIIGINRIKPAKFNQDLLLKAVEVTRIKPDVLLLGSSKEQWGLNPNHPGLSQGKSYNLGLQAANMYSVKRYFDHALKNQPNIKQIIIGLDFYQFNVNKDVTNAFAEHRLEKNHLSLTDAINIVFSVDAMEDSYRTLLRNFRNPTQEYLRVNRFQNVKYNVFENGTLIYNEKEKLPGSWKKFSQGLADQISTPLPYILSEESLDNLKFIADICREKGIDLRLFIAPDHVLQIEGYRVRGWWDEFEQWKRELAKIAPVWDFSGYYDITAEPIENEMEYYIDSLHYNKLLGDWILNRVLSYQDEQLPDDFGVLITPENVESHLENIRQQHQQWQIQSPETLKLVEKIKP